MEQDKEVYIVQEENVPKIKRFDCGILEAPNPGAHAKTDKLVQGTQNRNNAVVKTLRLFIEVDCDDIF
ncbi:MAG: hypothetical protein IPO92_17990 [Saprospiraceae bacterium]|nr:hypothetical protein [Saprospiraceae bacterium]